VGGEPVLLLTMIVRITPMLAVRSQAVHDNARGSLANQLNPGRVAGATNKKERERVATGICDCD
jgi:hypothetical protein